MTALEKFNEIKGLEKLKENYPHSRLIISEDINYPETMLVIESKDYIFNSFPYNLTFEYDETISNEVPPYITAFVGYGKDIYETTTTIQEAERMIDFLKEVNKILGLED